MADKAERYERCDCECACAVRANGDVTGETDREPKPEPAAGDPGTGLAGSVCVRAVGVVGAVCAVCELEGVSGEAADAPAVCLLSRSGLGPAPALAPPALRI